MLKVLSLIALATQVAAAPAATQGHELRGEALMTALKAGGHTVLLRHARTQPGSQETPGYTRLPRTQQRNLSDAGVADARLMGTVFKKFAIPFGEVLASPLFRTMETAEYAVGAATETPLLRTWPTTPEQGALVAAAPARGTNRLLVTHHFVIERFVPGIKRGDIAESEAAVVRPDGKGGVTLVGRISLADWQALGAETGGVAPHAQAQGLEMPDTPAGRLARSYLTAYNSGDESQVLRFIETALVPAPDRPTAARLEAWRSMRAQYGPLTVRGISASTPESLTLRADSRRGPVTLTVRASSEHAGRAASISLGVGSGHP